jgi:cyclophilin family peptidyl-prolyl cis-trans isomerase
MARTSVPDSATSQFFINTADNGFLNRAQSQDGVGYAVFGKVVEGTEVVDKIGKVKTGNKAGMGDVPLEPVVIHSVEVLAE